MDEPVEPAETDSGHQISDFDSESCPENPEPLPITRVSVVETPSFSVSGETRRRLLMGAVWRLSGH